MVGGEVMETIQVEMAWPAHREYSDPSPRKDTCAGGTDEGGEM